MHKVPRGGGQTDKGDPHLRSAGAVIGNHVHATDGELGHIRDLYVEHDSWEIRYIVVATTDWWPGKRVLMRPTAIREISWPHQEVELSITRQSLKDDPTWDPGEVEDPASR